MVDVGAKEATHRVATASAHNDESATFRLIAAGRAKKGDVLGVARIAPSGGWRVPELIRSRIRSP